MDSPPVLEHVFTLRLSADLSHGHLVGSTTKGIRNVFAVESGQLTGEKGGRMDGVVFDVIPGASADYILVDPTAGYNKLDVRLCLTERGSKGRKIFLDYQGIMKTTDQISELFGGKAKSPLKYGDANYLVKINMEAGDEDLNWIEFSTWIGQGRLVPAPEPYNAEVNYRIYLVRGNNTSQEA